MTTNRIPTLDIAKIIAIFFVIMAHLLYLYGETQSNIGFTINSIISCIGVPLFVCTTGALVIKKNLSSRDNMIKFYKHNLLSIITTSILWILFYFFVNKEFSFKELLLNLILIHKPEVHIWYIRMIVMYYLFMPLIVYLINKKLPVFIFIIIFIFCITFIYNGYLIYQGAKFPTTSGLSYSCYLIYLYAGYYISNRKLANIKSIVFIGIITLSFWCLLITHLKKEYMIWYDNPFILLISLSLFELIYRFTEKRKFSIIQQNNMTVLSNMTFGIYLSHMIIVNLFKQFNTNLSNTINTNILIYILSLIVLLCSVGLIFVIKKITPKLTYILFRYK